MTSLFKPPPIGALRRRLVLESFDRAPDGAGGVTGTWTPITIIWAAIHPRVGTATFFGDTYEGRVTHDIWIRPRTDITSAHRLRLNDGRLFNIRAVLRADQFVNRMRLICEQRNQ
jgi:SPP1 family predicted phage head-tail adaptor